MRNVRSDPTRECTSALHNVSKYSALKVPQSTFVLPEEVDRVHKCALPLGMNAVVIRLLSLRCSLPVLPALQAVLWLISL